MRIGSLVELSIFGDEVVSSREVFVIVSGLLRLWFDGSCTIVHELIPSLHSQPIAYVLCKCVVLTVFAYLQLFG